MRKLIMMLTAAGVLGIALTGFGEAVTNVRGAQRPNSNLVDIYYDLNATDGGKYTVKVEIEDRTNEVTAATFTGDVGEGIAPGKNRHILWDVGTDWPDKKGDVRAIVTAEREPEKGKPGRGVQLWEGGPYWADRNVGASSPEDAGLYFWWGDTTGYRPSGNTFGFSFAGSNCPTYNKNIGQLQSDGWIVNNNGTYVLAPSHDAARAHWGGSWRMPTYQELDDLCSNKCDWTWTTQNGVKGYIVRGRGAYASNSIFLPCAGYGNGASLREAASSGYYWSSAPRSGSNGSWYLFFISSYHRTGSSGRHYGRSVRPVQGFTN